MYQGIPGIVFIHPAVVLLTVAFPLHEITNFSLNVKKIKKGRKHVVDTYAGEHPASGFHNGFNFIFDLTSAFIRAVCDAR